MNPTVLLRSPAGAWLGAALCAFGLTLTCALLLAKPQLVPAFARAQATIDQRLDLLLKPPQGLAWVRVQVALSTVVTAALALGARPEVALLLPVIVWAPHLLLVRAVDKRRAHIEAQLDGWLTGLTNALRAAPALGEAMLSTLPMVRGGLRGELEVVMHKFNLGTPLDSALVEMAQRVGSPPLTAALTALRIASRTGGNLSATLETTAQALREMARLEGIVRTQTASGRAQALTIGLLPLPFILLLNYVDPSFLAPLWHTHLGNALAGLAAALWLVAGLWARRIVQVDL